MTDTPAIDPADVARVAKGLTKAQREMVSGRYDPEFARPEDAAALERLGLWEAGWEGDDETFWHFDITPLGLAVRAHLLESRA